MATTTINITSQILTGKTLWVDSVNGNDLTGVRGQQNKPYLTVTTAQTAASSGDEIRIRPGNYPETSLGKAGVYYHWEFGATNIVPDLSGANPIWVANAISYRIGGYGYFENQHVGDETGRIFDVRGAGSIIADIRGFKGNDNGGPCAFAIEASTLVVRCLEDAEGYGYCFYTDGDSYLYATGRDCYARGSNVVSLGDDDLKVYTNFNRYITTGATGGVVANIAYAGGGVEVIGDIVVNSSSVAGVAFLANGSSTNTIGFRHRGNIFVNKATSYAVSIGATITAPINFYGRIFNQSDNTVNQIAINNANAKVFFHSEIECYSGANPVVDIDAGELSYKKIKALSNDSSAHCIDKSGGTIKSGGELEKINSTAKLINRATLATDVLNFKYSDTITSSATPTIHVGSTDVFTITAQAEAITSFTTNLIGTGKAGQKLIIRILDNGTARAITWGASFASRGATLPTTTVLSKYLYVGLIYNSVTSTWDCVATSQET
jgi:hypothetical protein